MYNYITKSIRNTRWAIRNDGGFQKTASVCPGGVNPNDKTVTINCPPGRNGGGLMKTFHWPLIDRMPESASRLGGCLVWG